MIKDYKGFVYKKKKKNIRIFRIMAVIFILIFIYIFFSNNVDKNKIIRIQELLLKGKKEDALKVYKRINKSVYHKTSKKIIEGLLELYNKDFDGANEVFKTIKKDESLINHEKFITFFFEKLKYKEAGIYLKFLNGKTEKCDYYRALLATAVYNYKDSEKFLENINSAVKSKLKNEISNIIKINKAIKRGKINYIFDINGEPLAYYNIDKRRTYPFKNFRGLNFDLFTNTMENGIRYYTLTINKNIQNTVDGLYRRYGFNGSFVFLKTEDNSITVAYSKNNKYKNSVFSKQYEPGSIIKLLTLYGYFKNEIKGIFPYKCKSLTLSKKPFYDWVSHGIVNSFEQALAWSCNIGFAKIGLKLGIKSLNEIYEKFLFNRGIIKDEFINFSVGKFISEKVKDDYALAKVSVGLSVFNNNSKKRTKDLITITTIHSGLIASSIANKGIFFSPFLIRNIKSITNIGSYNHKKQEIQNINSTIIFNKIRDAMNKVVTDKTGTGKNAYIKNLNLALKTGTAGKHKPYNAIMTGFFPSNRPKYAFAFILEKSGPSKDKGARFLRDFLNSFHLRKMK